MVTSLDILQNLSLAEKLARTARLWKTVACNELAPLGLTHSRWTVLWLLKRHGDNVSQKILADALEIELASLMRTLGQLEEQGLIIRHSCPHDKRARMVIMTASGHDIVSQIESKILHVRQQLLVGISEQELLVLSQLLERITHNAQHTINETASL